MLAMLRVAPLLPSPTLRAAANGPQVGTGKQAQSIELESGVRRGAAWPPPVMHFYSGPPMHLLSGVDTLGFDWANRHREAVKGIAFMEAIVVPQGRDHWDKMGMRQALEALRSEAGEAMVVQNNYFIEEIL